MLTAALRYAAEEWKIIPCAGKEPAIRGQAGGVYDATDSPKKIRAWWKKFPQANIGIACGKINRLCVVDIDPRNGGDESWRELERKHSHWGRTAVVATGGGGMHWYFHTDKILRNRTIAPGVEIKNAGTYVLAPPSIHPETKKPYEWIEDLRSISKIPEDLAELIGEERRPSARAASGNAGGGKIPAGMRNHELISIAGSMQRRGISMETIRAALQRENVRRCVPPLDSKEVDGIVNSISRYSSKPVRDEMCTDMGNAKRLVKMFGHIMHYSHEMEKWLIWDDNRWRWDNTGEVSRLAQSMIESIFTEAKEEPDADRKKELLKWAKSSQSSGKIKSALEVTKSQQGIPIELEKLDSHPWLFNAANGTIDLRTGKLHKPDPAHLITKASPVEYNPDAGKKFEGSKWDLFLNTFLPGNDLQRWAQEASGYSMTGIISEQCFWVLYGEGANGKSTFIEVLLEVFGEDYSMSAPPTLFQPRNASQATNDVAALRGMRLVIEPDLQPMTPLNESLVKQLTGGDRLQARYLYAEWFQFHPQAKIMMAGNKRPVIRDQSYGMWRRVRLVPFRKRIKTEDRIRNYSKVLVREEAELILYWAVQGCLAWQRQGELPVIEEIEEATSEYQEELDIFQQFLEEWCEKEEDAWCELRDLHQHWSEWCRQSNVPRSLWRREYMLEELRRMRVKTTRVSNRMRVHGLNILQEKSGTVMWSAS